MSLTEEDDEFSYEESAPGGSSKSKFSKNIKTFKNDQYDAGLDVSHSSLGESKEFDRTGFASNGNGNNGGVIKNQPHDEMHEFSESDSERSIDTNKRREKLKALQQADSKTGTSPSHSSHHPHHAHGSEEKMVGKMAALPPNTSSGVNASATASSAGKKNEKQHSASSKKKLHSKDAKHTEGDESSEEENEEEDEDDEDEENDEESSYENLEGAYDPKDFDSLNVPSEVRDLFQYIVRYKPQEADLPTTLKCFIPEYIPAIGEIDAFIKIPRPDGKPDDVGLRFLDEPAGNQSDATVLELQLRAKTKKVHAGGGDVLVRSLENASKNSNQIDKWIQNIADLHSSKPPTQVQYKHSFPDIDTLMQVWPESFENALKTTALPSPDLDISLSEYAKLTCAILDIPCFENNPIESLHVMFSLYAEFMSNPQFQEFAQTQSNTNFSSSQMNQSAADYGDADVLEIEQYSGRK